MFEIVDKEEMKGAAKILVVGIGGGGCNAVNTMISAGLSGVEYIVANTDVQALNANFASTKIQLGAEITRGLGAGANPEVGRKAAMEEYEKLSDALEGADMVFITAGMGGGTGTGASPIVAQLAREIGALTVGVVTKPFMFEGKKRMRQAKEGIKSLEECVDSLITIPNQRLLQLAGENLSLVDTFKKADEVLLNAVQGISDLINNTGLINADFADVKTVMEGKGLALMGTGICSGPDRAIQAAEEAISSPLLEDITIDGATGIIVNISGDNSLTTFETNEAVTLIMEAADEDAEIIFGTVIDDTLGESIKITVIATGLGDNCDAPLVIKQDKMVISEEKIEPASEALIAEPKFEKVITEEPLTFLDEVAIPVDRSMNRDEEIPAIPQEGEFELRHQEPTHVVELEKAAPVQNEATMDSKSRAKSIAERLGFFNFDEDEFDTPTFIRRNNGDMNENIKQ